jgi:hypothetical protein
MSKEYYSLSQTPGKNDGPPIISVEVVRERDLTDPDGWDTEPLTKAELSAFRKEMKDETDVKFPSKAELKAVARKLRDRD